MNKILHLSLVSLLAFTPVGTTFAVPDPVEQGASGGDGSVAPSLPVARPSAPVVVKSKPVTPPVVKPADSGVSGKKTAVDAVAPVAGQLQPQVKAPVPVKAAPKVTVADQPTRKTVEPAPQPVVPLNKSAAVQTVKVVPQSSPVPAAPKSVAVSPAPVAPKSVAVSPAPAAPKSVAASPAPVAPKSVAASPAPAAPKSVAASPAPAAPKSVAASSALAASRGVAAPAAPVMSKVIATSPASQANASTSSMPEARKEVLSLKSLGLSKPIKLLGDEASAAVDFSFHTLDIVKKLHLRLKYDYSSKLDPKTSKLVVSVNGKEVGSFPLDAEGAAGSFRTIEVDPTLLSEWNHLSFYVASHLKDDPCDDPRSTEKWVRVYHRFSEIDAESFALPLTNDLALFPMPFFDKHETQPIKIPFVFSARPSDRTLKAAGVLASWFGNLAAWRGTNFSTKLGAVPGYDSIVLATVGEHIEGIDLPTSFDGFAQVSMVDNPTNPVNSRLLLIVGKTDKDLVDAVNALVLGKLMLEGSSISVLNREIAPQRALNDAPNWLPTNKKVMIGDLLPADQLNSKGVFVTPLQLNVRLPFNLFSTEEQSIPVTLKLQASNGGRKLTRIEALLNGDKFDSIPVKTAETQGMVAVQTVFSVPAAKMTGKDNLTFNFVFTETGKTQCAVDGIVYDEVRVDPTSSLDVSALPQYVELPNLSYMAYTGYPFSSRADLSGTVVLVPDLFSEREISSLLTVLGHIGEKTGYPATGLAVSSIREAAQFADRDVLIVGTTAHLDSLLQEWKYRIPVNPRGYLQPFPWPVNLFGSWQLFTEDGKGYSDRLGAWANVSFDLKEREHTPAFVASFESPLQNKRSVVLLAASTEDDLRDAAQMLATFDRANNFSGDVALVDVQKETVKSYRVAPTYSIGYMSIKERFQRLALHNPWVAFLLIFLLVMLAPEVLFNRLKSRADARLGQ